MDDFAQKYYICNTRTFSGSTKDFFRKYNIGIVRFRSDDTLKRATWPDFTQLFHLICSKAQLFYIKDDHRKRK